MKVKLKEEKKIKQYKKTKYKEPSLGKVQGEQTRNNSSSEQAHNQEIQGNPQFIPDTL